MSKEQWLAFSYKSAAQTRVNHSKIKGGIFKILIRRMVWTFWQSWDDCMGSEHSIVYVWHSDMYCTTVALKLF